MELIPDTIVSQEKASATECLLRVQAPPPSKPNPAAAFGFANRHGLPQRTTAEWMNILREGEDDPE